MSSDPRYTIFAARAVFDERLTPFDIRVLAALGTYSDKQGWCYPRQGEIAQRCAMSRQSVITSIKRLVAHGYVQVTPQVTEKGKQVSLYRVLLDLLAPEAAIAAAEPPVAEVVDFTDVQEIDTRMSTKTTGPDVVADIGEKAQDIVPAVQEIDIRLSRRLTPGCQPPLTSILDSAREPHNIFKKEEEKKKSIRAHRLPADWEPRPQEIAFGAEGGLSEPEVRAAAEHMRDWAASSPKASKLDWDRTFRNWLRTTISDAKRGRRPVVTGADDAERKRRLWVLRQYGEWRPEWGPRPDLTDDGGAP